MGQIVMRTGIGRQQKDIHAMGNDRHVSWVLAIFGVYEHLLFIAHARKELSGVNITFIRSLASQ